MDELEVICPPKNCEKKELIAFRWVFEDINDNRNFRPQYFKNPKRFNQKPPSLVCQSLGLSFYNSAENAKKKFDFLKKQMANKAYRILGKNLAEGTFLETNGVCGNINKEGHFSHYSYENVELYHQFKIIADL